MILIVLKVVRVGTVQVCLQSEYYSIQKKLEKLGIQQNSIELLNWNYYPLKIIVSSHPLNLPVKVVLAVKNTIVLLILVIPRVLLPVNTVGGINNTTVERWYNNRPGSEEQASQLSLVKKYF